MGLNGKLPDIFNTDVISVADYMERIGKIEEFCRENSQLSFHFYFRGDLYCERTQSNFFRHGNIKDESKNFKDWTENCTMQSKGLCTCDPKGSFECLAYMQHYLGNTRLLDFTKDAKVALRFACGRNGENCRKKVTVYNTDYISITDSKRFKLLNTFIKFVKSDFVLQKNDDIPNQDYFIEMDAEFPRIKRQHGLFLFMGNQPTSRSADDYENDEKMNSHEKCIHELSPTVGRGESYNGYVGVLTISPNCVEQIRKELEQTTAYNMKYLMGED